jgi:hypothetical protein
VTLTLDAYEAEELLRALDGWLPELEFTLSRVRSARDRHDLVVEDDESSRRVLEGHDPAGHEGRTLRESLGFGSWRAKRAC